jgi:pyruvate formate lyase activating enzyme
MIEVYLYKKLKKKTVQCQNCAHFCAIKPKEKGDCGVRENIDGKLYALNYGKVIALNVDPMEKKPLFHFLPGTHSLSLATVGCSFICEYCQNWDISQAFKNKEVPGQFLSPEEIVELAEKNKVPSISYTYSEPAIFSEYALDIMKLAKEKGLKNIWVTNGFWSKELFDLISPYLDATNVDLKDFSELFYEKVCGGRLKPVLETLKRLKKKKIWTEVTTLIVPTMNDSKEMLKKIAEFIKEELGSETPWHIARFSAAISWKLHDLRDTPLKTLKTAYDIGKKAGLKYVYMGNVPEVPYEDTYCTKCGEKMIDRRIYFVKRFDKDGKCSKCGESLDLILE